MARSARPTFFDTPAAFRRWLHQHHGTETELWVGFYKKATGKPTLTWAEAVDEALCFGWIDGVRRRVDDEAYTNRFTPRRKGSEWSAVNVRRAQELIAEGRMRPAGRTAFEARDSSKPPASSRASADVRLAPELEARFKAEPRAWAFFQAQPPGYRRTCVAMVMAAKQEVTRLRRLDIVIAHSAAGRRIDPMKPLRV